MWTESIGVDSGGAVGEKQHQREQKKAMKSTECIKVRFKAKYMRASFRVEVVAGFNFSMLW